VTAKNTSPGTRPAIIEISDAVTTTPTVKSVGARPSRHSPEDLGLRQLPYVRCVCASVGIVLLLGGWGQGEVPIHAADI